MISTKETAKILGVTGRRVRALIKSGHLAAIKTPQGYKVRRNVAEAFHHIVRADGRPMTQEEDTTDGTREGITGCEELLG